MGAVEPKREISDILKQRDMKPLSSTEKSRLERERNDFLRKRNRLGKKIRNYEDQLQDLRRQLIRDRPYIQSAQYTHYKCDVRGSIFIERKDDKLSYYCLFCEEKYMENV